MAKFHSKGVTLGWDETAVNVDFVQLSAVAIAFERETIEVTTHDTSGLWRENLKGFKAGTVSGEGIFDPAHATHANTDGVLRDFEDDANIHTFQMVFADSGTTTYTFDGIFTSVDISNDFEDAARFSFEIAIEGAPTLA